MGLVGCPWCIADEPGAWENNGGTLLFDAIETAKGKPGSPLRALYLGTLAPALSGWWHDLISGGTNGTTYVQALRGDPEKGVGCGKGPNDTLRTSRRLFANEQVEACHAVVLILRAPIPDLSLCPSRCARRSTGVMGSSLSLKNASPALFLVKRYLRGCREDFAPKSASWACNAAIHDKELFVVDPKARL